MQWPATGGISNMSGIHDSRDEVFERVDDAFFALDDAWRFTYLNDRAEEVLDVDQSVVGESVWDEFEAAVDTTFQYEYERAMETQESVSFEEYYPPLDSWFEVTAYPSETGLSVYFRDVTERRERERELERYETIVETVHEGIYVVDEDGTFAMVNEAYAEMLGYDRTELLDASVSTVVSEETVQRAAALYDELVETERETATMTATLTRKDGGTLVAEATFSLLPTGERVGIVRDITEEQAREQKLELFERIVETVEDGVYAISDDDRFIVVNEALCEMTGYDREELLGKKPSHIRDEWIGERAEELVAEVLDGEREEGAIEFDLNTKGGEHLSVEARVTPFSITQGTGRCGVVRDISERKERERELRDRIRQQQVVTELGKQALETQDIDHLMDEAARLVAETLDTDYAKVLELTDAGDELLLRQGVGWDEGIVGEATVSAVDRDSQAAHTLDATHPIVVDDLTTETRFSGPDLLTDHDVRSGISTIVGPTGDPWGVLGTHDTARREFSQHEVSFVQSVANILGAAIDRHQGQEELRRQHERLSAISDIDSLVHGLSESMFGLSTQEDIRELICERLADSDSYEFAWIGTVEDGDVVVDAEAGVEDYLDDVTLSMDDPPGEQGPAVRAHATGEMHAVPDVETDPRYEEWREHAREYGYRAAASIPLLDDGEMCGSLNLYSARSEAFSDEEREALQRLGSIIAYAFSSVERDRELQRERNRLEFMNRLLRHNLLNSLNVVEARLEMLDGRVDFEVATHLDTALGRTREMIDFVETIRKITKVIGENDGVDQELGPIDIQEAVETRVEHASDRHPEAEFDVADLPSVDVVADDLLSEVLDNVLVNAAQHNPHSDPTVWVDVTATDDEVVVSVADDGPGIPDEQKADIFRREAKTFDDPGSGFGLYLVREIMDSYGGEITVEDNDPEGARFRLTFQRA
ncbi:PAS domain S-box-containing protein [Haloplanus vescus]|uniref:histidine kinase n=2 Tax=Haloplanus vescus TaxID=555874 RepID=A0A1H3VPN1_9EURY|nr:PAS domain S-box-containing protein [Haloplanus vescus]